MANKNNEKKVAPKGANGWVTLTQWAENHGVSVAAVSKAADAGRLEDNGRRGRGRRVRGELIEASTAGKDLLTLKQEKMAVDIQLVEQRIRENRNAIKKELGGEVLEAFYIGFAPLKQILADLRLPDDLADKLTCTFEACTATFSQELRKRINE